MKSKPTQPFFVVSSGRSGTRMVDQLLGRLPDVEMHHEYLCTHVQPLAVRYYAGLITTDRAAQELAGLHGAAVHYSGKRLWGDSSNKLPWLIEPLEQVFSESKYVHLVRDGRKVASSFFNKLGNECYDDRSTRILSEWLNDPRSNPMPPPEKKYWWNIPNPGTEKANRFALYNQFERIVNHWVDVNQKILDSFKQIDPSRWRCFRLEDLISDQEELHSLFDFLELNYNEEYFSLMQRPVNVNVPKNFFLDDVQAQQFHRIAGNMMQCFGYDKPNEYEVNY